jgi:hypothetical protein
MATWEELDEALADYTISCNTNERLRKMQRLVSGPPLHLLGL